MRRCGCPAECRHWRRASAFTLVELIVVIVVLAVLSGVAVVKYQSAARHARDVAIAHEVRTVSSILSEYVLYSSQRPASFMYQSSTGGITDPALSSRFSVDPTLQAGPIGVPVTLTWYNYAQPQPSLLFATWVSPKYGTDVMTAADALRIDSLIDNSNNATGSIRTDIDEETDPIQALMITFQMSL